MSANPQQIKNIIEAALLAADQPLSVDRILSLFIESEQPSRDEIKQAIEDLARDCEQRGIELKEIASGYRLQVKEEYASWVSRLWEERPARYSRALLETLVLIAYKQPITRGDIEDVRGVAVSSHIIKTLQEREWIRVLGHREVPGRPSLYGTTKQFLDYFNLKSLEELPKLEDIKDLDDVNIALNFGEAVNEATSSDEGESSDETQSLQPMASLDDDSFEENETAVSDEAPADMTNNADASTSTPDDSTGQTANGTL